MKSIFFKCKVPPITTPCGNAMIIIPILLLKKLKHGDITKFDKAYISKEGAKLLVKIQVHMPLLFLPHHKVPHV